MQEIKLNGESMNIVDDNIEKLKTAFHFGADACYFAGKKYGLRAQRRASLLKILMHIHPRQNYILCEEWIDLLS